jgi:purine-nucleoside phosphorylase
MEGKMDQRLEETRVFIQSRFPERPDIAIVLGSGLSVLAGLIEGATTIPYREIPHFVQPTVSGHAGELICGVLEKRRVICMSGRFHFYEGHSLDVITYPIKVFKLLGVTTLILTNAVGGVNSSFAPGDFMIINDHINMMGVNPLVGVNNDQLGPRFPDMSEVYSRRLIGVARKAARAMSLDIREGVYVALTGPSYETPAEIRMIRTLGGDAVGMSTVPEAIVARHMGLETLAISCVTNAAAGIEERPLSHDEVTATASRVKEKFCELVSNIIKVVD